MTFPVIAAFTNPMNISANPQSLLWILPLAVAGVVVYKALTIRKIVPALFFKEVFALLAFLIGLLIVITLILFAITWLAT